MELAPASPRGVVPAQKARPWAGPTSAASEPGRFETDPPDGANPPPSVNDPQTLPRKPLLSRLASFSCRMVRTLSLVVAVWLPFAAFAQIGRGTDFSQLGGGGGGFGGAGGGSGGALTVVQDTGKIYYFALGQPHQDLPFTDSTLFNFQQYDPIRRGAFDYVHLGNLGSAARPVVYRPRFRRGFEVGLNAYELYRKTLDEQRFYRITQAYSHAFFSQGSSQSDTYFKARFSRDFAGGLNLAIDYEAINNVGSFRYQKSRNNSLSLGMWWHKNERYDGFFSYITSNVQQQNNGGYVGSDTIINPIAVDTRFATETAVTRYQFRDWAYTQYYKIGRLDSLGRQRRTFNGMHRIRWTSGRYRYSDSAGDAERYGVFATDDRGVRFFLRDRFLENTVQLGTFRLRQRSGEEALSAEADQVNVGLTHTLHLLEEDDLDSTINNLFLRGEVGFSPSERLRIRTRGHLGFLRNVGDYRVEGELFFDLKKVGSLRAQFVNQLASPTYVQERFTVTGTRVFERNLRKTLSTSLLGTYRLPGIDFTATGGYHLIDNLIYYDTSGVAQQRSGVSNVLQLVVQQNLRLGPLHVDNQLTFQTSTAEALRLPGFYGRHSLYVQGRILRNGVLLAKLGFDARLSSGYRADTFNPLTGQFQLQDDVTLPFTPLIDAFFAFRVERFRGFVRAENLVPIVRRRFYAQVPTYYLPFGMPSGFRFGVSWRFVD